MYRGISNPSIHFGLLYATCFLSPESLTQTASRSLQPFLQGSLGERPNVYNFAVKLLDPGLQTLPVSTNIVTLATNPLNIYLFYTMQLLQVILEYGHTVQLQNCHLCWTRLLVAPQDVTFSLPASPRIAAAIYNKSSSEDEIANVNVLRRHRTRRVQSLHPLNWVPNLYYN